MVAICIHQGRGKYSDTEFQFRAAKFGKGEPEGLTLFKLKASPD